MIISRPSTIVAAFAFDSAQTPPAEADGEGSPSGDRATRGNKLPPGDVNNTFVPMTSRLMYFLDLPFQLEQSATHYDTEILHGQSPVCLLHKSGLQILFDFLYLRGLPRAKSSSLGRERRLLGHSWNASQRCERRILVRGCHLCGLIAE